MWDLMRYSTEAGDSKKREFKLRAPGRFPPGKSEERTSITTKSSSLLMILDATSSGDM